MVTHTKKTLLECEEAYEEMQSFERMQSSHDGKMPAGSSRSSIRGRQRSRPAKKRYRAPQQCRGVQHRRIRKWK